MSGDRPTVIYTGTRRPDGIRAVNLVHHPVLKVEAAEVDEEEIIKRLRRTDIVVFYSRNAVDVACDLQLFRHIESENLTALAVGPKTASYIERRLDFPADYPESEYSFEKLVELLVQRDVSERVIASFELVDSPNCLAKEIDGDVTSHGIYRTVPNDRSIRDEVVNHPGAGVALTSPRGVRVLADDPELDSDWLADHVELGAIGPKTGEQLAATIGEPSVILDKPDKVRLIERLAEVVG